MYGKKISAKAMRVKLGVQSRLVWKNILQSVKNRSKGLSSI